jgi:hypothetical protein
MPQITVPKEFFIKERRMYSNWQFAFWREFFQNSLDGGATRIDIVMNHEVDREVSIVFADNGCGMSRETLENVYFRLGATSKEGDSFVGGFGRARILTCFSMQSYQIRTRNNLVVGDGGDYEISDSANYDGTEVTVKIVDENYYDLNAALIEYLRSSQMTCQVFVNHVRFNDWNHRRQLTRHLELNNQEFASVYVNKTGGIKNTIFYRINGAVMFSEYIAAPCQVIVEIHNASSRQVLTANRDGMHSAYRTIVSRFTQELASETTSALQPRFKSKSAKIIGSGMFMSRCKKPQTVEPEGASIQSGASDTLIRTGDVLQVSELIGAFPKNLFNTDLRVEVKASDYHGGRFVANLPDIYIVDDTINEKVRRVIDNYMPSNWVTLYRTNGKSINKGGTIYKVLMTWKLCCEFAMDSLLTAYPSLNQITWGIGWVFDDNALAIHKQIDYGHALLLNPVDSDGNLRFFLRSQKSQKEMMAIAKHEVAHVVESYHNESFAKILTTIDAHFDEREVYKAIRTCIY